MAFSEMSFGARLENARKLLEQLHTFKDYSPLIDTTTAAHLEQLINETAGYYNDATDNIENHSNAVELRQQLYIKAPDALIRLLSSVSSTVRSVYGKQSKQAETISALVAKIRGDQSKKPSKNADEEAISQSQRSFGNMAQGLEDMIVILGKYNYKPANSKIALKALRELHQSLLDANQAVTSTHTGQKQARDKRQQQYETLNQTTQSIKDAVKSQYGPQSTEYKLVKGLKI